MKKNVFENTRVRKNVANAVFVSIRVRKKNLPTQKNSARIELLYNTKKSKP